MNQDKDAQRMMVVLYSYQEAINRADADAAASLFLDGGRIVEEGVQYPSVRAVIDYDVGLQTHIRLSEPVISGKRVSCLYFMRQALDRAVGYAGSTRRADFTFAQNRIATLEIYPLDCEEHECTEDLLSPFFTWIKTYHPAEWAEVSNLNYEGGAMLATMVQAWQDSQLSS